MKERIFVGLLGTLLAGTAGNAQAQTPVLTPYSTSYNCTALPLAALPGHTWSPSATYSLISIVNAMKQPNADLAIVTAHRGYWETCPENSLEAFHAAIDTGVEAVEMDIRPTKDGSPFVLHDYNLRGEASRLSYVGEPGADMIYTLTSTVVESTSRALVDRHGVAFPSSSSPEFRIRLLDLLDSYVQREQATAGDVGNNSTNPYVCSNGQPLRSQVQRGPLVILDIKGDDVQKGLPGVNDNYTGQYAALKLAMDTMLSVECQTGMDLSQAVVFKLSGKDLPTATNFSSYFRTTYPSHTLPQLIPIIFAGDFLPTSSGAPAWNTLCTYFSTASPCNSLAALAGGPAKQGYGQLVVGDWQLVYPNTSAEQYALAWRQAGGGVAGFMGVNSFPEGFRDSNGTCFLNDVKDGFPTLCRSQPLTVVASSSLDYLLPSLNLPGQQGGQSQKANLYRATAITTDWFQDAIAYLSAIGRRNLSHIQ